MYSEQPKEVIYKTIRFPITVLVKNPIQTSHRPGNLLIFEHKNLFESAIVAGNKLFAADDARIRKIAFAVPQTVASA